MFSVLSLPGALRAFIPALIGRLAFAMVGLALLLAVQQSTGSFAVAGLVTAICGIANVVASPWRARSVDRWGQRRALSVLASVQVASLLALALVVAGSDPTTPALVALAVLIGLSSPPLGAAMRVIWSTLTQPGVERKNAFSLDATCEELLFVGGPVLIAWIITVSSPSVGLVTAAGAAGIGSLGLVLSSASQQVRGSTEPTPRSDRPLRQRGFARVLAALIGVGLILGTIEVFAPAYATAENAVELSGWLLAAFAAGSALGGIVYGTLPLRSSLAARLTALIVGLSVTVALLALAPSMILVAVGLFVAGLFLAPSLITGYLIADDVVPPTAQTEASAWINTVINLGASIGAGVAGVVIEGFNGEVLLLGAAVVTLAGIAFIPRHLASAHAQEQVRDDGTISDVGR